MIDKGYIHDKNGNIINPAKEEALEQFNSDFNAKIPQPFTFDSNGRIKINADLQVADIEIGAVEIKDGDSDTRAKVDTDNAVIAGLNNAGGTRINPSTDDKIDEKIPQPLSFDSNGNIKVYMGNSAIAYDSDNDLFRQSIEKDSVGLAKENTLSAINGKMDVNLSGAGKEYLYNESDSKSIYDRLVELLNKLDVALSTRSSEDTLSSIDGKVTKVDTDNVEISQDKVGLAKENTLESIDGNIDAKLSTRASESTQSSILSQVQTLNSKVDELENKLDDLDPLQSDYIELKFSGSYDSGTYTADYTPQNGEIDYIDFIALNSSDGSADLTIDFDGDVKGRVSVDNSYAGGIMNAYQPIRMKIVGDGSKKITLTLDASSNGHYFAKAIIWKVKR